MKGEVNRMEGSKPIVVCASWFGNCANMDDAHEKAVALAHEYNTTAYILKPVRAIAPKHEVIVTALK